MKMQGDKMWEFKPHQIEDAKHIASLLKTYKIALCSAEERTAKTGGFLLACEMLYSNSDILIITKKAAESGWQEHLDNLPLKQNNRYFLITHHQYNNVPRIKWATIAIDESHATFAGYPKAGKIIINWHKTGIFNKTPMVFISATMASRSFSSMYHQLVLCDYSPFAKFKNFKDWFNTYGIPEVKFLHSRQIPVYDKTEGVMEALAHLFVDRTRAELGFEHEAEDRIIYVEPSLPLKTMYNQIVKQQMITLDNQTYPVLTKPSENSLLHQLEGGTLSVMTDETNPEERTSFFVDTTKIQYLLDNYEDTPDLVIFYHFQLEKQLLECNFKHAHILQGITYSAGVDLHHIEKAVVYSMDYSTANYSQRRNRQVNMNRKTPIIVDYLLIHNSISEAIYTTVALNKKTFVDAFHQAGEI